MAEFFTAKYGAIPGLTDGAGLPVFAWVALALPLVCVFVVGMVIAARSWLSFHPVSRTLALAGVCCWIGVIIAEIAEAQLSRHGMARSFQGAIEEGLEITGATLFLVGFVEFLQHVQPARTPVEIAAPQTHPANVQDSRAASPIAQPNV